MLSCAAISAALLLLLCSRYSRINLVEFFVENFHFSALHTHTHYDVGDDTLSPSFFTTASAAATAAFAYASHSQTQTPRLTFVVVVTVVGKRDEKTTQPFVL